MIHYADEDEVTDLFAEVERRGIPYDHHETDLYIPVTPETQELIDNYHFKKQVERFRSNIAPHDMWFDIPFAYTPAWEKKSRARERVSASWDSRFHNEAIGGDRRYDYVPFHQLSPRDQDMARRAYPHKSAGGKYDFIDEHYLYPIKRNGQLADARRELAIPYAMITDEAAMADLGYEINEAWKNR